jgi:hypothetical protein
MEPTFKTHDRIGEWLEQPHENQSEARKRALRQLFGGMHQEEGTRHLYLDTPWVDGKVEPIVAPTKQKESVLDAINQAFIELRRKPVSYLVLGQFSHEIEPDWLAGKFLGTKGLICAGLVEPLPLEHEFQQHARKWIEETGHLSSETQIVLHPSYQRIIGMGPAVLPLIFRDLKMQPRDWFWALNAITGEDPVEAGDAGNVPRMVDAWLHWGQEHGYV